MIWSGATWNSSRARSVLIMAIFASVISNVDAYAEENPWVKIRERAIIYAEQAQFEWNSGGQVSGKDVQRFLDLVDKEAVPLRSEEVIQLIEHSSSVILPSHFPVGVVVDKNQECLVTTGIEQNIVCAVAISGMLKGMPAREQKAFQGIKGVMFSGTQTSMDIAVAAISMSSKRQDRDWLYEFVFGRQYEQWHYRLRKVDAIPLLMGDSDRSLLEPLQQLLVQETNRSSSGADRNTHEHFVAKSIANVAQSTINAEKYCQTLDVADQKLFRDFYLRLHQAFSCSPSHFRSGEIGRANLAVRIMVHDPNDKKFYRSFLTDWDPSTQELYCIAAIYRRSDPIDVEELKNVKNGKMPQAQIIKEILDDWGV